MDDDLVFRSTLLKVAKNLAHDDIEGIKYILRAKIGIGILENIKSSLDLFDALEKLDYITPSSFDFLIQLFEGIGRQDLINQLKGVPSGQSAPNISIPVKLEQSEQIDRRVLDLIANHITTDWKRLGRLLEVSESKIEQIDNDYRKTNEKSWQLIISWTKSCAVSWNMVKDALEELPRFDIIRLVEENFPTINVLPPVFNHNQQDPQSPPSQGHGYMQASSSISDENAQYAGTSNLRNKFSVMKIEDEKEYAIAQNGKPGSGSSDSDLEVNQHSLRPDCYEQRQPTTISENQAESSSIETVLT